MNLYKPLSLVCGLVLFGAGCGTPTGKVQVTPATGSAAGVTTPEIEAFDLGEAPDRAFRRIAELSAEGMSGDYLDVLQQFKLKARELGADAIILEDPVSFTGDRYPYEHLMFRAVAIAYQNRGARASR